MKTWLYIISLIVVLSLCISILFIGLYIRNFNSYIPTSTCITTGIEHINTCIK
jgi:hypothetical protein